MKIPVQAVATRIVALKPSTTSFTVSETCVGPVWAQLLVLG